jgi:hypothetical protein
MTPMESGDELLGLDLSALKDRYRGRRAYVIGNGPSINKTDLARLKDEITIGMNRIYLKFADMGYSTTFLCCVNELVLQQFGQQIAGQTSYKLLNASAAADLGSRPGLQFMASDPSAGFARDLSDHVWHPGATVTYCALQLAFHLGIEEVILLGVDHSFTHAGRAHRAEKAGGGDVNHFDPNYFGKGVLWQYPDLADSELNYATAREVFRIHGRSIKDATVGGRLAIFDRVTGYALDSGDDVIPLAEGGASTPHGIGGADFRSRVYARVLNNSAQRPIAMVGAIIAAAGLALLAMVAFENPAVLLAVLGTLLLLGGAGLGLSSVAADWVSAWARKRRLKDGQLLLNALSMIR